MAILAGTILFWPVFYKKRVVPPSTPVERGVKILPPDFQWGVATSAFQNEGKPSPSNWKQWVDAGKTETTVAPADEWRDIHTFQADVERMKKLGITHLRMSIAWDRVCPARGVIKSEVLMQYRYMLRLLQEAEIKVSMTLWHFVDPAWFPGWDRANDHDIDQFIMYALRVQDMFEELVDSWVTFNEPWVFSRMGWLSGQWPPGRTGRLDLADRVVKNMIKTHNQVYDLFQKVTKRPVGIVHNMDLATPLTGSLIEWGVAALLEWYFNWRLLKAVKVDFVGLNYYFRVRVIMGVPLMINQLVPEKDRNDFGWEIYPYGMYLSLVRVARHKNVPIIVTENGVADRFDTKRANALLDHLQWLVEARLAGVDVRGYYHWTLLDNFEWAAGTNQKFGLFEVDQVTRRRIERPSARLYASIIDAWRHAAVPTKR
ncbi:MAG: family 1 glycosylhydrolase [Patescibacteria group bacterium]